MFVLHIWVVVLICDLLPSLDFMFCLFVWGFFLVCFGGFRVFCFCWHELKDSRSIQIVCRMTTASWGIFNYWSRITGPFLTQLGTKTSIGIIFFWSLPLVYKGIIHLVKIIKNSRSEINSFSKSWNFPRYLSLEWI